MTTVLQTGAVLIKTEIQSFCLNQELSIPTQSINESYDNMGTIKRILENKII